MGRGGTPAPGLPERRRADIHLVELGLFESRAKAQAAIAAGLVRADGEPVRKPSDTIPVTARIEAEAPHPWVSRGGVKLTAALDGFGIDPAGANCLDVGASTGGFTEVLLSRGAARVYAVDVGQGQLHPRLAGDPRVVMLEQTDIRHLDRSRVAAEIDLCTVDVSFISLKLVVPELTRFVKNGGYLIALIKPQFEVGRAGLSRGGIVRDAATRDAALNELSRFIAERNFTVLGTMPSPIEGGDGNREFLLAARHG